LDLVRQLPHLLANRAPRGGHRSIGILIEHNINIAGVCQERGNTGVFRGQIGASQRAEQPVSVASKNCDWTNQWVRMMSVVCTKPIQQFERLLSQMSAGGLNVSGIGLQH
jgi:hypothetical protein